jgi:regulator of replication initiation timing
MAGICSPRSLAGVRNQETSKREFHPDLFGQHYPMSKRRRVEPGSDDALISNINSESFASAPSTSQSFALSHVGSPFGMAKGQNKRSRFDRDETNENAGPIAGRLYKQQEEIAHLRNELEQRVSEVDGLKREKSSLEETVSQTRTELEKVNNENRILKRAVTIQQERQNQASSEIEAACRYRTDAEERIRRLEHMNSVLRFQLEARDSAPKHTFMGFEPRPPDVF